MQKKKILIVDDNEDLSKGLRLLLRAHDYATVAAADAVSAISQAKNEKPDLILLDLGLPAGDGFKVMERLNNVDSLASIPVIVLSARDMQSSKEQSLRAGAKAFFQKPADNEELLASIKQVLEESSHAAG
ncbi:MAG TPA: response regulator [Candidatus Binatia bacterium]|jgi:DNA-binding response OmpR family regulator|nr:response regulator [Candidatus Binatia bacterium]